VLSPPPRIAAQCAIAQQRTDDRRSFFRVGDGKVAMPVLDLVPKFLLPPRGICDHSSVIAEVA
jgi:hypothetical protein